MIYRELPIDARQSESDEGGSQLSPVVAPMETNRKVLRGAFGGGHLTAAHLELFQVEDGEHSHASSTESCIDCLITVERQYLQSRMQHRDICSSKG